MFDPYERNSPTQHEESISHPIEPRRIRPEAIHDRSRWPQPPTGEHLARLRVWVALREAALANPAVLDAKRNAEQPRQVEFKTVPPDVMAAIGLCRDVARQVAAKLPFGATTRPLGLVAPSGFSDYYSAIARVNATRSRTVAVRQDKGRLCKGVPFFNGHRDALSQLVLGYAAEFYGVGNCQERACLAFGELVQSGAPGAVVMIAAFERRDHVVALYRPTPASPLIVCDPWLPQAQACLAEDYHLFPEGCTDPLQLTGEHSLTIDAEVEVTPEAKIAFAEMSDVLRRRVAAPGVTPAGTPEDVPWYFRTIIERFVGMDVRANRDPGTVLTYRTDAPPGRPC